LILERRQELIATGITIDCRYILWQPEHFEAVPRLGVRAEVNRVIIAVGNAHMLASSVPVSITQALERQAKTLLLVEQADNLIGVLAAADTIRPEAPANNGH